MTDTSKDTLRGTVVNVASVACTVDTPEGELTCAARGRLTERETDERNPVTVGDRVIVEKTDEGEGVVTERLPRRSRLVRTSPQNPRQKHVIVANLDQVVIVVAVRQPPLNVGIIDRYVIAALYGGMEPVICVNKIDLAGDEAEYEQVAELYRDLDYPVVLTSAKTGEGLEDLKDKLAGKSSVFAGHSGVGKSSLLNAIQPGLELRTAPLGWKGKHCTSAVNLLKVGGDAYVADTPGIRELSPWDIDRHEVQQFFPEIWEKSSECKMPDCTHMHEPRCAVLEAVDEGEIDPRRYDSYTSIVETVVQLTEPRETDVEQPREQVSQKKREPSRRTRKQKLEERFEEEIENYYRRRGDENDSAG
ncbi:MAG: ribosome small subunit-dependent GTPase A [Planctomycetota bacterium]